MISASCVRCPFDRWLVFCREVEPELIESARSVSTFHRVAERREVVERLAHGHPRIERDVVGHVGQPRLDGDFVARRIEAEHAHRAARRPQQIQQALDRRRLAGAVAAEEAVAAAGLDAQVEAVDRVGATEPADEAGDLDDRL